MSLNLFSKIKQDLPASIVVFLVALPLCLGVALASGAPLLSGVISGIIGGIVVGFLSQSHTSVSGPAAGLVAVVLTAIAQLQSYEAFLMAVVIAGFMQLIIGFAKGGFIANFIPANVIKGLLSAIGIIIILKQIPHAVGYDVDPESDFAFNQVNGDNTFSEILKMFSHITEGAVIVSVISLLILIYWDKTPLKNIKVFPASLFVVLFGIALNSFLYFYHPSFYITSEHLVSIPKINSIADLTIFPNFSSIFNYQVWIVAATIAVIASLETLLNLEAVEKIDPHKRVASPNREMIAQGVGNIFSGLVGGLPITSVIVRSSVNINSGAATKLSTILHGVFLLLSILLLSKFMNMIPLASLAAILLLTGYKLTKLSLFTKMYHKGANQFIPFIATVVAIIFTDLLIGVLIGLAVSIFYILKSNYNNPFDLEKNTINMGETISIELPNQVSFLNKVTIKDTLWSLPKDSKVIINASNCNYIDSDVLSILEEFKTIVAVENNIQLNIIGLRNSYNLVDQIQFINVLDKEAQLKLSPNEILEMLKLGNERFHNGKLSDKYFKHQVNATAFGQNPVAIILSCIDSRTSPEIIFDMGLGDIISVRIAGNIMNQEVLGSIELAAVEIGAKLIVVLGHSNCGAVMSAIHLNKKGNIKHISSKIEVAINQCNCTEEALEKNPELLDKVINANVQNTIKQILDDSEYLSEKVRTNEIMIVPAFYDTQTGKVSF